MFKKVIVFCFIVTGLMTVAFSAHAGIAISRAIVEFPSKDKSNQDVIVYNNGAKTEYVKVSLFSIDSNNKKHPIKIGDKSGIMANPQKLILPPKSSKVVRFIKLHDNLKKEKIYRAHIEPSVAIAKKVGTERDDIEASVKVIIAYGVLINMLPDNIKTDIRNKKSHKQITFINKGNASVLFSNGKQCDSKGKNCKEIKGKRLYRGKKWSLKLPYNTPLEFSYRSGKKVHRKVF